VSVRRIRTLLSRLPEWSAERDPNLPAELATELSSLLKNLDMRIHDLHLALEASDLGSRAAPLELHVRGLAETLGSSAASGRESATPHQNGDAIIAWRELANRLVRGADSGFADWVAPAFRQVTGILENEAFPCIFARQANHLKSGWACFVDSVDHEAGRETVRRAILAYIDTLKRYSRTRSTIMPLMIVVKPCTPMLSLKEYRDQAWGLFQYLHDHDPEPWPSDVPPDPDRGDWSFCFGGIQLFSNVSNPAHLIHKSRNLGDSLVFAMQPRTNFDLVGGNNKKGRQVRREIRARAERYEGRPAATHLGFFGTPENREWLQMATKDSEAEHDYPKVCPFRFNAGKAAVPAAVSPESSAPVAAKPKARAATSPESSPPVAAKPRARAATSRDE
jgi:FPC/CPF motif-containing protein YcgG